MASQNLTCSVIACDRDAFARGWCRGHYARWFKTGDVRADEPLRTAIPVDMKRCPECEEVKPLGAFGASATRSQGVKAWCKPCEKTLKTTKWRDGIYAYQAQWRKANPEKTARYGRNYARNNRDKIKAKNARLKERKPELYAAIARAGDANRRARERNAPGKATAEQVAARWAYYGGKCWMCGRPAVETDHVKPLAAGGSHWPSNLRPACRSCNSIKRARWPFKPEEVRAA